MASVAGYLLVPTPQNADTGLWLVFHHEAEGIMAVDITKPHPEIPYRLFKQNFPAERMEAEVLLGGDMQQDSAMLIFHNRPEPGEDKHILHDRLGFLSYRLVIVPGQPPELQMADETPTKAAIPMDAEFFITIGFRLWDIEKFEEELKAWQWSLLPATPELLFGTPPSNRLKAARGQIN